MHAAYCKHIVYRRGVVFPGIEHKQLQGEQYLRERNLLVSPRVIKLTEEIKRKSRRTQVKEDAKRELRLRYTSSAHSAVTDQITQTDNAHSFLSDDGDSDTSSEDLIFVPDQNISSYSIVKRTVKFYITLLASFIIAIAICALIGYYFRVHFLYSRL